MKKPLIIIAGPTASGKTGVSVALAKQINGEIISADSMQVYKGMDIGTAKVTPQEQEGVIHHLIDLLEPDQACNIAWFKEQVTRSINAIYQKGKVPILVGGTGFYIQAILYDTHFGEESSDKTYRRELEALAKLPEGPGVLYDRLMAVDPNSQGVIHPNNVKRVIRGLEYYHETGEPISVHNEREKAKSSPYDFGFYVLTMNRDLLYTRIDNRVDMMLEQGLVQEVIDLMDRGYDKELVSMQGLGYKEIIDYLEGAVSLEEAVNILKRDTRHFAKRQLTWFRREPVVTWVDVTSLCHDRAEIVNIIRKDIEVKKIL